MKASIIEEKSRNFKPFILNISIENITDLKYLWLSFGMCIGSVIQYYKNKDHEKIEHQIAVEVLQKLHLMDDVDLVSTGGGAMLAYLATDGKIPGILALRQSARVR